MTLRDLRVLRGVAVFVALAVASASAQTARPPKLDTLLAGLSTYLAGYELQMSSIVADEFYRQESTIISADFDTTQTRILQSDFVFMRVPGELAWLGLRDTYAVDGVAVRDRDARLVAMLSGGKDALRQVQQIAEANARYNLGDLPRTINIPTLPLGLLLPQHRRRFTFGVVGNETVGNQLLAKVNFVERQRPSIIRSQGGRDQLVRGTVWLDASTGAIHKTQLDVDTMRGNRTVNTRIVVEYARDERLDMLVPHRMAETYDQPLDRALRGFMIEATATYFNYRRFQTSGRLVQ